MDQPELEFAEHVQALQGLRRINKFSRTASVLWPSIARLTKSTGKRGRPLRILDLATGGGDTPLALSQRAARVGLNVHLDGCDINPQAIRYAQEQAETHDTSVQFFVLDALNDAIPSDYDVLICSLFLHHLGEADVIALLQRMATATRHMVLVDDLIRSQWGYLLALAGCHLLSSSRIVHVDGPISVAAAFTPDEVSTFAEQAGLYGTTVTRHWPHRFLLSWTKK